ncbi:MAG: hypothetical protein RIC55_21535 [Pirellulaceae bacterium]
MYVLSYIGSVAAGCCWQFSFEETCGFDVLVACISNPIALGYQLEVTLGQQDNALEVITWLKDLGSYSPDCSEWSDIDLPITAQSQTQCDDDSATCTVTAI